MLCQGHSQTCLRTSRPRHVSGLTRPTISAFCSARVARPSVKRKPVTAWVAQNATLGGQAQDDFEPSPVPFARRGEKNAYRLLGISEEASFEEIVDARNYLQKTYGWDEPSKDAIELAFDAVIQDKLVERRKVGPRIMRRGKFGQMVYARASPSVWRRLEGLFDPTVTAANFINDGLVYGALTLWAFLTSELTMPLSFAMCYAVYSFQSRRTARDPEGPFWGGNALFGAFFATFATLAVAAASGIALDMLLTQLRITNILGRSLMPPVTVAALGFLAIVLK